MTTYTIQYNTTPSAYTIQYLTTSAAAIALKEDKLVVLTETTTARTLLLTDASKYIRCTNSSAISVTVPPQTSVAFPSPTRLVIEKSGTGNVTIVAGSGVTLNSPAGLIISTQYGCAELIKTSTDVWTATLLSGGSGDLLAANNLSDLNSVAIAQTNLGLGTTDDVTFASLTTTDNATIGASIVSNRSGNSLGIDTLREIRTNEAGSGSFSETISGYAGAYGETRQDNVYQFGYNIPSTPTYNSSDVSFSWNFESFYKTSEGIRQAEIYFTCNGGSYSALSNRPFYIGPKWDLGTVNVAFQSDTVDFLSSDNLICAQFDMDPGGDVRQHMYYDSSIDYLGTHLNGLIRKGGNEILGYTDSAVDRADFGKGFLRAGILNGLNPYVYDAYLEFCDSSVIKLGWNYTNQRFEFTDALGVHYPMKQLTNFCNFESLTRSLGANAGDTIEIALVHSFTTYSTFAKFIIVGKGNGSCQEFVVPFNVITEATSGAYRQVWPTTSDDQLSIALDVIKSSTGIRARLRRVNTVVGATICQCLVQVYGDGNITSYSATDTDVAVPAIYVNQPGELQSYTVATLPSAVGKPKIIYISDEAGGPVIAFNDGTNWRRSNAGIAFDFGTFATPLN